MKKLKNLIGNIEIFSFILSLISMGLFIILFMIMLFTSSYIYIAVAKSMLAILIYFSLIFIISMILESLINQFLSEE